MPKIPKVTQLLKQARALNVPKSISVTRKDFGEDTLSRHYHEVYGSHGGALTTDEGDRLTTDENTILTS